MNRRRLLGWGVVFFGLLAYVLLFEKPEVKVEAPAQRGDYEKVFALDRSDIDAVKITRQGRSVTVGRSGLKWQVTDPAGAEVLPEQCESVLDAVTDAVVLSVVETNPKNLTQYGLDAPGMVICVNPDEAGKRSTLALGKKAPSDVSMYGFDVERRRVVLLGTYLSFSVGMFADNIKTASRQE